MKNNNSSRIHIVKYYLHPGEFRMFFDRRTIGNVFKKAVKEKSQDIYDVLQVDYTKTGVDAIREIRDWIVHRDFIKALSGGNIRYKNEVCFFWLDKQTYELFEKAGLKKAGVKKTEDNIFIDIHELIYFLENRVVDITNSLLKIITEEIYGKKDTYEIWKILEFPMEPYVL